MLRRILLATASVIAVSAAANAADMYRAPEGVSYKDAPYVGVNWSGFYLGANGGGAWSEGNNQFMILGLGGLAPSGGFGGGQIGYNAQRGTMVFGVEADFQGAGISASKTIVPGVTDFSKLDWFGSLRGRVGMTFDRALVYGTGGVAFGGVHNHIQIGVLPLDKSQEAVGYTVGAGLEYKISPAFSVKGEYQYINLGKSCPEFAGVCATAVGFNVRDDAYHTARIGLNYHVGSTYEPLK